MLKPIPKTRMIPHRYLILNPSATEILTKNDIEFARNGLVVIDCSWKRADEVFGRKFRGINRRLPLLLAANPTNFGHLCTLSSAEALSAALRIVGFRSEAEKLLAQFKWGRTFLDLNAEPLEDYSKAEDSEAIATLEREYFARQTGLF